MKKMGQNQRSHPSELIPGDVSRSDLLVTIWVGTIAFVVPIAAAVLLVHFPLVISRSWTPYILVAPAMPAFVYIVSRRSNDQRNQIKSLLKLSWVVWALMGLVSLFYFLSAGNVGLAISLSQFSAGWLTIVFAWFFSTVLGHIALLISNFFDR